MPDGERWTACDIEAELREAARRLYPTETPVEAWEKFQQWMRERRNDRAAPDR